MGEMARRIVKLDKGELLKMLNAALAEEWLAYYQYWIGAKIVVGAMRPHIQEEFEKHAKEELKHADWLATRIVQLDGTPVLSPADWDKVVKCKYETPDDSYVMTILKQKLDSERCAIGRNQSICDACFGKDYETFRICSKILRDEIDHEQDMEDYINDISSAMGHF